VIENFIGTKSWRKILEGLKRKVDIFIGTKNIFNPKKNQQLISYDLNFFKNLICIHWKSKSFLHMHQIMMSLIMVSQYPPLK